MLLRFAIVSLLCLPLLFAWLMRGRTSVPDHRQHQRVTPLDVLLDPADQTDVPHVSFDCGGCGGESSKLRYPQTTIVQTPTGYALVGVCRTQREHSDGQVRPCGRALVSRMVAADVAAEFVYQGAKPEYSRLVVFRAELDDVDLMNKISRPL